ncbi:hypothetical protein Tco_0572910 [Tanacetum coccineum]
MWIISRGVVLLILMRQESNALFGSQDLCLRQELLEYMGVHDNDASESSQPSWGKISKLEYKFQDKENSEDIFSFGSALEDFISVVFVHDRNIDCGSQTKRKLSDVERASNSMLGKREKIVPWSRKKEVRSKNEFEIDVRRSDLEVGVNILSMELHLKQVWKELAGYHFMVLVTREVRLNIRIEFGGQRNNQQDSGLKGVEGLTLERCNSEFGKKDKLEPS